MLVQSKCQSTRKYRWVMISRIPDIPLQSISGEVLASGSGICFAASPIILDIPEDRILRLVHPASVVQSWHPVYNFCILAIDSRISKRRSVVGRLSDINNLTHHCVVGYIGVCTGCTAAFVPWCSHRCFYRIRYFHVCTHTLAEINPPVIINYPLRSAVEQIRFIVSSENLVTAGTLTDKIYLRLAFYRYIL